ncbi:MAG: hypothetical protein M5U26_20700 [Planctomycetota bacterium]|nr:hypothetical protein [Planctomycetota bacterium]
MAAEVATRPAPLDAPPALLDPEHEHDAFADPLYGKEAEHGAHVICSHPTWSLDENQRPLTGYVGLGVVVAAGLVLALLREAPAPRFLYGAVPDELYFWILARIRGLWDYRYQWIILFTFLAMFLTETLVFRVHRRHFDFMRPRRVGPAGWARILQRWLALAFCFALATSLYITLGEYSFMSFNLGEALSGTPWSELPRHFYGRYIMFYVYAVPAVLVLCIPYFYLVERFARRDGPIDEWLVLWHCLRRAAAGPFSRSRRADAWSALKNQHIHNLFRALGVKLFWTPLMMTWCLNVWESFETNAHFFLYLRHSVVWSDPHQVSFTMRNLHFLALDFLICIDLTVGLVGYLSAMRLIDTQTTSAEPTLFGWLVALLCYPPVNMLLTSLYFGYGSNEGWIHYFVDMPVYSMMANFMSILLMALYVWATFAFGLRFSNLTNRGIVFIGPYKVIRHPAYITKNGAWWFEALPFLSPGPPFQKFLMCLHLLAINIIYGLRAWTEERHLMREPHYREYCRRVKWRFIPGIF